MKILKTYNQLYENYEISLFDAIHRNKIKEVINIINKNKETLFLDDINYCVIKSRYDMFKFFVSKFDFGLEKTVGLMKNIVKKLCSIGTNTDFKSSSRFSWISLILDKNEYHWNDKDGKGKDFLDYACDSLKEKIKKKISKTI